MSANDEPDLVRPLRVCAVVVAFQPRPDKLSALLDAVEPQVEKIIVVDNGSAGVNDWLPSMREKPGVEFMLNDRNLGIAAAHNQGIAAARGMGADAVLLLDQDSMPSPDMVSELSRALASLSRDGSPIAALGPSHVDDRTGIQAPFIRFGYTRNDHVYCGKDGSGVIRCDHLISSGSLIPLAALDAIGGMEDGLFVDNVDTEWCFRAMSRGYQLFGVCSAVMSHGVGDALVETWIPFSDKVVVHSPIRLYYIIRNHILLYGRRYTPVKWKLQDLPRLVFKAMIFSTSISPRSANISMMWKGFLDGARGKTGSYGM